MIYGWHYNISMIFCDTSDVNDGWRESKKQNFGIYLHSPDERKTEVNEKKNERK